MHVFDRIFFMSTLRIKGIMTSEMRKLLLWVMTEVIWMIRVIHNSKDNSREALEIEKWQKLGM